jgi:L-amino acid N-acyltransferase YncA
MFRWEDSVPPSIRTEDTDREEVTGIYENALAQLGKTTTSMRAKLPSLEEIERRMQDGTDAGAEVFDAVHRRIKK